MSRHSAENQADDQVLNALAVACHEIRGSLSAIVAHAEILCEDGITADRREEVAALVARSGRTLLLLFDDILLAARIDSGEFTPEQEPCHVRELLEDVHALFSSKAEALGLSFELEMDDTIPDAILSDTTALHRILVNLVGNALKFTEIGGVHLRAQWSSDSRLQIRVEDTGIGVDPQELATLFDRFVQGSGGPKMMRGVGLGLALSRELARAMFGDVTVSSELGRGSTFEVNLPAPRAQLHQQEHLLHGFHVLVAEDCPDSRVLVEHQLVVLGATVSLAGDGAELLAQLGALRQANEPFHAIILDLEMPRLDGRETAIALRSRGYSGPILALSAHGPGPQHESALSAGCDMCLSKPIDQNRLAQALQRLLSPDRTRLAG